MIVANMDEKNRRQF